MRFNDLSGRRYGRLTVIKRAENNKHNKIMWLCRCDCGGESLIAGSSLVSGKTKSCGCLIKEKTSERNTKHGYTISQKVLCTTRCNIIARCNNPHNKSFEFYGGRGIRVCKEWADSKSGVQAFCEWAISNGYKEGLTIDRIDVNGDYEPCNCRWTSRYIQSLNRRAKKNKSGYPGVFELPSGRYRAVITINGKRTSLGVYGTAKEAAEAYKNAKQKRDEEAMRQPFCFVEG